MLDPDRRAYIETMVGIATDFPDGAFWGFMQEKGIDAEELLEFSTGADPALGMDQGEGWVEGNEERG